LTGQDTANRIGLIHNGGAGLPAGGLVDGAAGNVSARRRDGNLDIAASSVDYSDMTLDDLAVVDSEGGGLQAPDRRSRRRTEAALSLLPRSHCRFVAGCDAGGGEG
jgi:ribulose-5-phosphate 4-epimerase/fuculose-1-phosphate aldolase